MSSDKNCLCLRVSSHTFVKKEQVSQIRTETDRQKKKWAHQCSVFRIHSTGYLKSMIFTLMQFLPPGHAFAQKPWGKLPITLGRRILKTEASFFHKKTTEAKPSIPPSIPKHPEVSKPGARAVTDAWRTGMWNVCNGPCLESKCSYSVAAWAEGVTQARCTQKNQ